MKQLLALIILLVSVAAVSADDTAPESTAFVTVSDFRSASGELQEAYIAGLQDMLFFMSDVIDTPESHALTACVTTMKMDLSQLTAFFKLRIEENSENWQYAAADQYFEEITALCKLRK